MFQLLGSLVRWAVILGLLSVVSSACAQPVREGAGQPAAPSGEGGLRPPRSEAERRALRNELPNPAEFDGSPSAQGHFGSPKQASTWIEGPKTNNVAIQVLDLERAFGARIGTSPWHVVSTRRYRGTDAVTLWGATLTDAYRIIVDGERFEASGRFAINRFPTSIPWNLFAADDGRVFVPDPNGRRMRPGWTTGPTLLVLGDDADGSGRLDQEITLQRAVELDERSIREACRPPMGARLVEGPTGSNFRPGFNGEFITKAEFEVDGGRLSYLVVLDHDFTIVAAGEIGPTGPSNDIAAEPDGPGRTAFYVPTDLAIVKMVYDANRRVVERRWSAALPIRGRLGTTPTLMNTPEGERFVIVVDAKAAVVSALNGLIVYSDDTRPGALIAVRRDDDLGGRPRIIRSELPSWLGAVENSPAVRGGVAVITNYTGYLPNGLVVPPGGKAPPIDPGRWAVSPDARPEFATGVVAVRYDAGTQQFVTMWERPRLQFSNVPTISESSNMVYGTGAEERTGRTYFYGVRLLDDADGPGGELVIRQDIGAAPFREPRTDRRGNVIFARSDYRLAEGEFFDAGNNLLILEDRSAIVNGGRSLVRIRDR